MKKYDPKKIEPKWQKYWQKNKIFEANENSTKEKFYGLIEFPYPSGEGLHVGHPRPFTAMDVISRKKRMEGKNVLFPIGFDAFGLPTENFAIKTGKPPAEVTKKNIANFTRQLKMLGFSFDWSRQVDTTDPNYYRWTQWLFLQFFKHGLAYKKNQPINWCPKDKIGLANEEVVGGCCERCGTVVETKNKEQWMLAITKYADKLLAGLKDVDYIERAKVSQENWIGKSEGAEVIFPLRVSGQDEGKYSVKVFTTRPDTIFGATFIAISADLATEWISAGWNPSEEIKKYITEVLQSKTTTNTREEQEKTGISVGVMAINPVSKEEIPVWVTNYVMGGVGTGAVMGVPAHDERDFDFAKKFGLPIKKVVQDGDEKTKYLIFDFDGVIADTYEQCIQANMIVDKITRAEAVDKINKYYNSKPNHAKVHSLSDVQLNGRLDWTRKFGEAMVKMEYALFDDFNKIIGNLQNIKVAIISAGSGLYIRNRVPDTGLNPSHVLTYEDHHSKEEKIEQVCKDWGISMQEVYYFADTKADVYELEDALDRKKIIGCAWGYQGYDVLREVLPEEQILKKPEDLYKLFVDEAYTDNGVAVNSDFLNGLKTAEAKAKMISWLEENKIGKKQINYKLRDWVFSRQRYWGEPIPLVYCATCADWIPLPESELPLKLPKVEKYQPTDNGESPLAAMEKWLKTKCPQCGGPARRETDTMPNWAGSSWYFLAYALGGESRLKEPGDKFWDKELLKQWMPVDWYNGGMEHTVLHLLYSRFWNIFLHDIGLVPTSEPYKKRTSHGMILAKGGEKMSKSKGNVVNPDEMVEKFGADALRTYIMFMGPFDQAVEWDTNGLVGVRRFLEKVWMLQERIQKEKLPNSKIDTLLHQTIKKVTEDIEAMRFNTAVAKIMTLVNEMGTVDSLSNNQYQILIKLLSPFAPHICEEIWSQFGNQKTLVFESWPKYDEVLTKESEVTIAVQVNGKLRDTIIMPADISEEEAKKIVLASEKIQKWLEGKELKKIIYVKGKLVSIVV
jgi:leucyl-tRNA synthetase